MTRESMDRIVNDHFMYEATRSSAAPMDRYAAGPRFAAFMSDSSRP
jgi:hypothetical protein